MKPKKQTAIQTKQNDDRRDLIKAMQKVIYGSNTRELARDLLLKGNLTVPERNFTDQYDYWFSGELSQDEEEEAQGGVVDASWALYDQLISSKKQFSWRERAFVEDVEEWFEAMRRANP